MSAAPTITPRYELLALRIVQGMTIADAGAAVGYAPNSAYTIAASPQFKVYLDELRRQVRESCVVDVAQKIAMEAAPSVDRLVHLRDFAAEESVQRGCANDLLDRNQATAKISRSETKAAVSINFGAEAVRYLDAVIAERPGQAIVDAEALALPSADEYVRPRTIDELVEAYDGDDR